MRDHTMRDVDLTGPGDLPEAAPMPFWAKFFLLVLATPLTLLTIFVVHAID